MRSPRALSSVGTLGLLLSLCVATSPASATDVAGPEPAPELTASERAERTLRADAVDPVAVRTEPDGVASFVGTLGRPVEAGGEVASATPVQAARGHLDRYGALFGIDSPGAQLRTTDVVHAVAGSDVVRFGQQVDGLPVLGGELAVSLDADGDLESVNGETTDGVTDVPAPAVPAADAVGTAVRVTARTHSVRTSALGSSHATRWLYDPELLGVPDALGPRPVWRVEVTNGADISELVLVDSATGRVAAHVNQVAHLDRVVCDRADRPGPVVNCARGYDRTEDSGASSVTDVNRAFAHSGDTAGLYRTLGVDLTRLIGHDTGDGKKIRSTVRYCDPSAPCPMENAFWNGREMYYGTGFAAADDVVAHELTHGVIQHTSNLLYWYQSGAINESMADVFGEITDLRNNRQRPDGGDRRWVIGEDIRGPVIRDMRRPTRKIRPGLPRQPDRMRSRFYLADRDLVDNGGVHINSGVGNKAAYLIANGDTFNGRRVRGLGLDKTARIYLRALQMLTSGSDYADLGRVLPQACRNLAGRGGIRAADCTQVRKAVLATQMHLQPRQAQAPEAPRCPPRTSLRRRAFFDNMERPRRVWRLGPLWSRAPRAGLPEYATSGRRSVHGLNPVPDLGSPRSGSLTLERRFRVRRGAQTFLHFDHAYLFEYNGRAGAAARYFDGGLVEYSTNGGRTWSNTARLPWVNGPRRTVLAGGGTRNNFRGFGGESFGYGSSRLNLTRLAGRTVRLRWQVRGDVTTRPGVVDGWWLDDVEVFSCGRRAAARTS